MPDTASVDVQPAAQVLGVVVARTGADVLVIRTAWLFGRNGKSFPRSMWERARSGQPTKVVNDQHGRPTTNPGVVVVPQPGGMFGALLAFGEHKGYGMAVACELLGGALTGSGTWHRPADNLRAVINGMFTIVVDPKKLGTQESFEGEAKAFVEWLRQSPPAPGSEGVLLAGEPDADEEQHRVGGNGERNEPTAGFSGGRRLGHVRVSALRVAVRAHLRIGDRGLRLTGGARKCAAAHGGARGSYRPGRGPCRALRRGRA